MLFTLHAGLADTNALSACTVKVEPSIAPQVVQQIQWCNIAEPSRESLQLLQSKEPN